MEITKQFFDLLRWTSIKASLIFSKQKHFPKVMEVWWFSIGLNIGTEINGKNDNFERPALILKVFNSQSVLIAPLTTKIKDSKYLFNISIDGSESAIILSQLRNISNKRALRMICKIDERTYELILEKIKTNVLTKNTPTSGISLGLAVAKP